ncbi:MarR family winged helix-turn-helix transcriptional regulator [Shimia marina]|uniref:HTH-type transcriptional regulator TcaR n=1 Tax=Shimia marina TaxID=321267 RepID=A0A0P1FB68_9RHOB|nr:MarR family transcriptional regulator [Shimia marina]CUH52455.1 HTH-type transcriptional regulator TcaR [Shimia marina]SFE12214.1 transcriptional regulator, MarR family [Shimia marina]
MSGSDDFDLTQFLPYLLNQAAEESSLGFQKVYKGRYGILRSEWRVLFHLGVYGRLTATEIGQKAKVHKTKVSRAVQKLAERRYLKRTPCEMDRRLEWLELTVAGQAVYRDLHGVAAQFEQELKAKLTAQEAQSLKSILAKLS